MSGASQQAQTAGQVDSEPGVLAAGLGFAPVPLSHRLSGHPLLTLEALVRLAQEHPVSWTMHHLAALPLMIPLDQLPQVDAPPGEIAEQIETNGSRLTMYYLERLRAYRALAADCTDIITPLLSSEGGVDRAGVNVFMASPGAVVPAHFDNHHNLLLQVEGTKEVFVGAYSNPASGHREIERAFDEGRNNCVQLPTVVTRYLLEPGKGLYIPPYLFHWVKGGTGVSIALSCGISTASTKRAERLHMFNARLRRLGLAPQAPGWHSRRDDTKVRLMDYWRSIRRFRTRVALASAAKFHR